VAAGVDVARIDHLIATGADCRSKEKEQEPEAKFNPRRASHRTARIVPHPRARRKSPTLNRLRGLATMLAVSFVPRLFAAALAVATAGSAPFQCARKPGPDRSIEEEPGQALYTLAQQFKADGNAQARTETLEFIVKKYPTSRFAEQARVDLGAK
jgi:hypothetical protein